MITSNVPVFSNHAIIDFHAVINRTYTKNGNSPYFTDSVIYDQIIEKNKFIPYSVTHTEKRQMHCTVKPNGSRFEMTLSIGVPNNCRGKYDPTIVLIDSVEDFEKCLQDFFDKNLNLHLQNELV